MSIELLPQHPLYRINHASGQEREVNWCAGHIFVHGYDGYCAYNLPNNCNYIYKHRYRNHIEFLTHSTAKTVS